MNDITITHDTDARRFFTEIDGHTAYLSYVESYVEGDTKDGTVLNYNHTIVPAELGGRGLGKILVRHALDYAKDNDKKIIPSCSFVAAFIDKNTEYQMLLA